MTFLWKGAEWAEREAYDMFGIIFEGNRDLRRIYMPPDYTSFPLRKDFLLPDDAARSPGEGFRHVEQTHQPARDAPAGAPPGTELGTTDQHDQPAARGDRGCHDRHDREPRSARSTTRTSWSRRRRPSTTPSRRTRRAPSARRSSTTCATARCCINLGPQHPSTHGVLRVVLKIDGERVVDLDPVLGYLHRGVEKICENGDWHHAISNCDPLEYVASMFSEAMPVHGRREAARPAGARAAPSTSASLAWELNRIASHAPVHRLAGARPGRPDADPVRLHRARRDRRDAGRADRPAAALQLPAHRRRQPRPQPRLPVAPGRLDEPRRQRARAGDAAAQRERDLRPPHARPGRRSTRETALRHVPDGPHLRATGVPYDVRRAHPYSVYPELEFDIPTRTEGDSYARYLLHLDEIRESIQHHRPGACTRCPTARSWPSSRGCSAIPPGRAFVAIESPRGQYACYGMSDGSDQPFRLRIHDPSFFNLPGRRRSCCRAT